MNTYKNYIDLLRNMFKNFDNNEFNDVIKKILSKLLMNIIFIEMKKFTV